MELKQYLVRSNDPTFILNNICSFEGIVYYANHSEKIIRDGCFLSESVYLNGIGRLINYAERNIKIYIGTFVEDKPIGSHIIITSDQHFYPIYVECIKNITKKNITNQYYGKASKKIYIPVDTKRNKSTTPKFKAVDSYDIFIKINTCNGNLLDCSYNDITVDIDKHINNIVFFDDIFNKTK
jgi:hypothetical protein